MSHVCWELESRRHVKAYWQGGYKTPSRHVWHGDLPGTCCWNRTWDTRDTVATKA